MLMLYEPGTGTCGNVSESLIHPIPVPCSIAKLLGWFQSKSKKTSRSESVVGSSPVDGVKFCVSNTRLMPSLGLSEGPSASCAVAVGGLAWMHDGFDGAVVTGGPLVGAVVGSSAAVVVGAVGLLQDQIGTSSTNNVMCHKVVDETRRGVKWGDNLSVPREADPPRLLFRSVITLPLEAVSSVALRTR